MKIVQRFEAERNENKYNADNPYRHYTTAELRSFWRARRHVDGDWMIRGVLMRFLLDTEGETTFRFFDLLPELRNQVYEYLLILEPRQPGIKTFC